MNCPAEMGGKGTCGEISNLLGFSLCTGAPQDVLGLVWGRMLARQTTHIVTLNPEIIMTAQQETAVGELLQQADLLTADGQGVVWSARMLRCSQVHRYPGIDLVTDLMARMAEQSLSVYLLGSTNEVVKLAADNLAAQFPGLRIAGIHHGFLDRDMVSSVVEDIRISKPDLLLVGMGCPKQERFIVEHRQELSTPVMVGVGGALEVMAGQRKRAPKWICNCGLEWAFRAVADTTRLKRLGVLPRFVFMVLSKALRRVE